MNAETRKRYGLTDETATPTTQLGWLLDLTKNHRVPGLKYAVGFKINHALRRDTNGEFCGLGEDEVSGFRFLVEEVLSWDDTMSDALRSLLKSEYSWAVRYVQDLVPTLPVGEIPVSRLPALFTRLNLLLASDFEGAGLPYAIRMFTVPPIAGAGIPCERQAHWFREFGDQIMSRGDWLTTRLLEEMKKTEFAPFAHLLSLKPSASSGDTPILGITYATSPADREK